MLQSIVKRSPGSHLIRTCRVDRMAVGCYWNRSMSNSTSTLSCDIVLASPSLKVLKLRNAGTGKVMTGQQVRFEHVDESPATTGVIVLHRYPLLFVSGNFKNGANNIANVSVGADCGINPDGSLFEVDDLVAGSDSSERCSRFEQVPDASEVQVLTRPLHTGITAIDVLTPIARGQNMLFAGVLATTPDIVTETFQTIIRNAPASDGVKCIYISSPKNEDVHKMSLLNKESVVQMYDADACVPVRLNILPSELHRHMELAGRCARFLLLAHSACSLGNFYRKQGLHSVVMLDEDLYQLELLWNFSSACLNQFVYGPASVVDNSGFSNANATDNAGNSSEKRRYYAFIFQQVGEQVDSLGGGSMSLLCRINQLSLSQCTVDGGEGGSLTSENSLTEIIAPFSLSDFEVAQYPKKITDRIKLLMDRGIMITPAVLNKLEIPLPRSAAAASSEGVPLSSTLIPLPRFKRLIDEFVHEIKSHTDGHVIFEARKGKGAVLSAIDDFNTTLNHPPLVPNLSLSRVGGGSDKKVVHCGIPAIKNLTAQLRGDLSQVNDIMPSDHSAMAENRRLRALSWMCALEQNVAAGPLLIIEQVVLLTYVQRGYYDDFIRSIIREHGIDTAAGTDDQQWARLKELVFRKYDVEAFNRSLMTACEHVLPCIDRDKLERQLQKTGRLDECSALDIDHWVSEGYASAIVNFDQFRKSGAI